MSANALNTTYSKAEYSRIFFPQTILHLLNGHWYISHDAVQIHFQLIELEELKALLKKSISGTTDRMVERTFKEIDTDESGSLDFLEALAVGILFLYLGKGPNIQN